MKTRIIILIFSFTLLSFSQTNQVDDATKFKMFCTALEYESTAPYFLVVKVKNLNTNEKKELCTEAPFLRGAINRETGIFTRYFDCSKFKEMYFEFSKDSALWNIDFDLYSKADLDSFAMTLNIPEIVQQVKSEVLRNKTFMGGRKEQRMFAHLMFNNGVMMTRGCIAGNISRLTYFISK